MGQSKSKSWHRLSESDCVHLLTDDELNNHNGNNSNGLYPPTSFQNAEYKYHTITNANKWGQQNSNNNKQTNNQLEDIFMRNRSGSALGCTSSPADAQLLKFSKFENGEFSKQKNVQNSKTNSMYNKNLYEPRKDGSIVRKTLPPCPPGGQGQQFRHPRFYPSMLEPELLLRPTKVSNHELDQQFPHPSELIESPPPLDAPPGFIKSSSARPITMYQFDPSFKAGAFQTRSSMTRGMSLSDMLEQFNTFDEGDEEFSDQTMVEVNTTNGTLPPTDGVDGHGDDDGHHEKPDNVGESNQVNDCILVDISDPNEPKSSNSMLPHPQSQPQLVDPPCQMRQLPVFAGIRCSGQDCICDRCIQHRFKLLNWLLPNCTRINAERLLHGRMEGTFLVRKSEKFPGQYTLSFVCRRTVRHCLIMRSVYGFGLRWPYSFETLQQVIIHYARHTLAEFNSKLDVRLRFPVFMT